MINLDFFFNFKNKIFYTGISDPLEAQLNQMRHLAVIPPSLLDEDQRKFQFNNNNGIIEEPLKLYKVRNLLYKF